MNTRRGFAGSASSQNNFMPRQCRSGIGQGRTSWLELRPLTGRSHQLRVQLAARGLPILGDRKYGARHRLLALDGQPRVALHAWKLVFTHPTRPEAIEVVAPVPADWPAAGRGTG